MNDLTRQMDNCRPDMERLLQKIVHLESPSTDKAAVDRLGEMLAHRLRDAGCRVNMLRQEEYGDHLVAQLGGGGIGVLVIGHMDTVWSAGEATERPFCTCDNLAFGPGVEDMKSGIVQALFALEAVRHRNQLTGPVTLLINSDEEVGSPTSRPVIEEYARDARAVLVLESAPDVETIFTTRKGVGMFDLHARGRAAHAGANPTEGRSAIEEMARQITALHDMTDYDRGTTVNVGTLRGGTRPNVVAAEATARVDIRVSTRREAERLTRAISSLQPQIDGVHLQVEGGMNRPPMEPDRGTAELFSRARAEGDKLGLQLKETSSGGGSDGNFTASVGTPTLDGLGGVGGGAHSLHEYVYLDCMPVRTALLVRLLETL